MPDPAPLTRFLAGDDVVQTTHPDVVALAASLRARSGSDERAPSGSDEEFARAAFEWVRDEVGHSFDVQDSRVTLTAAKVLEHRVGLCYAKSHLLAAVLRAQGVPTALCYQRLVHGEDAFVLHGLVAVHLRGGWHRQDPRGNKEGVDAQFSLDEERLAWPVDVASGEVDYPTLHVSPAPCVVEVLSSADDMLALYDDGLPTELTSSPGPGRDGVRRD